MASFIGNEVTLAGTTPQTVVSSPAGGKYREVLSIVAVNYDTASRIIIAKKLKTAGSISTEIGRMTLDARGGGSGPYAKGQLLLGDEVLDDTDETITVESDATAETAEPKVTVATFEVP